MGIRATGPVSIRIGRDMKVQRRLQMKTIVKCASKIAQNPFEGSHMKRTQIVHKQTYLLNSIVYIRASESEILQGTSKTAIYGGIGNSSTGQIEELGGSITMCVTGVAIRHHSSLTDLGGILAL